MTLRYEINPPKITQNSNLSQEDTLKLLDKVKLRVSEISTSCDGIHFTDSVLGIPRISPITTGTLIRKSNQKIEITVSLRVRDKNLTTLRQLMEDAVSGGLNGVLILKGDPSPNEQKDSGLIPSSTVKYFKELGFDKKIDIFLSLPSNPSFDKIQKKKNAKSAKFLKLDWSEYKNSVEDFIKQVHQIAGEVLITTPYDFNYAKEILGKL